VRPAARPSRPSERFRALIKPTIAKTVTATVKEDNGKAPIPKISPKPVNLRWLREMKMRDAMISPMNFIVGGMEYLSSRRPTNTMTAAPMAKAMIKSENFIHIIIVKNIAEAIPKPPRRGVGLLWIFR